MPHFGPCLPPPCRPSSSPPSFFPPRFFRSLPLRLPHPLVAPPLSRLCACLRTCPLSSLPSWIFLFAFFWPCLSLVFTSLPPLAVLSLFLSTYLLPILPPSPSVVRLACLPPCVLLGFSYWPFSGLAFPLSLPHSRPRRPLSFPLSLPAVHFASLPICRFPYLPTSFSPCVIFC